MLKKTLKWASLPVAAIFAFVSFSAFTGGGESCGANHIEKCKEGSTMHCEKRFCMKQDCMQKVADCRRPWNSNEALDCYSPND